MRWTSKGSLIILAVFMVAFAGTTATSNVDSDNSVTDRERYKTLTGTWVMSGELGGEPAVALVTFHADGTLIATPPTAANVNAHGVWKKVGPQTYVEKNREFVYDGDQDLAYYADTREFIELSVDGLTYTSEAVTEIKLLDGTVVNSVSFVAKGERMTVDF